ncbi:13321_t:CDS:2, partial [Funneliformis mosseae]
REKNSTELSNNNTDNTQRQDAPIKSNNIDQCVDLNRDSWITMSDLSFLESLYSRPSSVSSTKKSQRKSEMLLDDFLDIGATSTTTTPTNNNYRMDSFITQIHHDSTELIANLETLLKKILRQKKSTSSISSDFEDVVSAIPSGNLNQENFLNFNDQVLPKSSSSNNDTTSSIFGEKILADDADLFGSSKPNEQNNKIMIIGFRTSTTKYIRFKSYTPSMNVGSTTDSSEFGEMVSAYDHRNLQYDWIIG